jgi:hypothetical protein
VVALSACSEGDDRRDITVPPFTSVEPIEPDPMTEVPAPTDQGTPAPASSCGEDALAGWRAPIRRLTRFEYNNTVRDLFGDTTQPANLLPPEELGNGFGNDADKISVSSLLAEQYGTVAEGIAARATSSPDALASLSPCASTLAADTEDACMRTVIEDLASRAFRRPLAAAEADELFALGQTLRETAGATFATAIAGVIEAILQSPDFLYRIELGVPDPARPALRRPSGDEMATRLSYLFWGTQPDDTLRAAARTGELLTAEGVRAQAVRMLDDPRSRTVIRFFFDNLLPISGLTDVTRDRELFPTFSSEIGAAMREETQRFLEYEIFEAGGSWASILSAPYTFVNGPLASFYGMTGVPADSDFVMAPVDTSQRLGLITQAGVMAGTITTNQSNPVLRGSFVLNRLLCLSIALPTDPAILAMVQVPDDASGATARERFSKHSSQQVCRGCHQLLDPIGFALEQYDPVGQFRTEENGVLIDAAGQMPDGDVIDGGVGLARWLAENPQAQSCFAEHWLEFAYGRTLTRDDRCVQSAFDAAIEKSEYNVREMLIELTQTEAFLYYTGSP